MHVKDYEGIIQYFQGQHMQGKKKGFATITATNTKLKYFWSSSTYLLSSADTAVHLSFSILNSTDPSISMGSTNQQTISAPCSKH